MKIPATLATRGPRPVLAGGTLLLLSALVAACGGGSTVATPPPGAASGKPAAALKSAGKVTTTTTGGQQVSGGHNAGVAVLRPSAAGTIATISGQSLEVQNPQSGQTTVDITAKTQITATVDVTLSAVKAGDCVTAGGTKGASGGLSATSVSIVLASGANCTGFAGPGRAGADGRRFGTGSFTPPSGARARPVVNRPANSATVIGKVKSVSGTTIDVSGYLRSFAPTAARPAAATSRTRPAVATIAVTVGASTSYVQVGPGTAGSLRVGECATAFGPANDIGAVSATRLSVSPATAGACSFGGFGGLGGLGGFGRLGGGPRAFPAGAGGSGPAGPAGTSGAAA